MTKMMVVDKQFLADIYGISYAFDYDYNRKQYFIYEAFSDPCREMYPTVDEAYTALVDKITNENKKTIADFEEFRNTWKGRFKMIRYSLGLLPATHMKYLASRLVELDICMQSTNIPVKDSVLKLLGDQFLISESFIRPSQKLYVFVKEHSIHFESAVYEADTYWVGAEIYNYGDGNLPKIVMKVDLHSLTKVGEDKQHFHIDWSDFSKFDDDYITTNIKGQFIFHDKEKCLSFAREMLGKDIDKLQNNIETLAL